MVIILMHDYIFYNTAIKILELLYSNLINI